MAVAPPPVHVWSRLLESMMKMLEGKNRRREEEFIIIRPSQPTGGRPIKGKGKTSELRNEKRRVSEAKEKKKKSGRGGGLFVEAQYLARLHTSSYHTHTTAPALHRIIITGRAEKTNKKRKIATPTNAPQALILQQTPPIPRPPPTPDDLFERSHKLA